MPIQELGGESQGNSVQLLRCTSLESETMPEASYLGEWEKKDSTVSQSSIVKQKYISHLTWKSRSHTLEDE